MLGVVGVGLFGVIGAAAALSRPTARVADALPSAAGAVAAVGALQRADLIVALGARFDDRVTGRLDSFAPGARIVHADIDPAEISKNRKADVPIVGDCKEILGELITAVRFPVQSERRVAFSEVARRHGDFAIIAIAASVETAVATAKGAQVVRIGIGGVADRPAVRRIVIDGAGAAKSAFEALAWELEGYDDIHASARLRRDLANARWLAGQVEADLVVRDDAGGHVAHRRRRRRAAADERDDRERSDRDDQDADDRDRPAKADAAPLRRPRRAERAGLVDDLDTGGWQARSGLER